MSDQLQETLDRAAYKQERHERRRAERETTLALLARCERLIRQCMTTHEEPSWWEMHQLALELAPYRKEEETP